MTKIETELADAARRLLAATLSLRPNRGLDSMELALSRAVDAFDEQQLLRAAFVTRLPDEKLRDVLAEECIAGSWMGAKSLSAKRIREGKDACEMSIGSAVSAMRRIADYADHLRGLIVQLSANADLEALIYATRDNELQDWDGPRVKAVGEAVAGMLAEARLCAPPTSKAGIDATKDCSAIAEPRQAFAESTCDQPWTLRDGKPFCDTCGLFRASVRP